MKQFKLVAMSICSVLLLWTLFSGPVVAQINCGDVITSDVTLVGDVTCPAGFTGTVLTIGADGITFDGAGHTITAPDAGVIFLAISKTGITIKDVIVTPGTGSGDGVQLTNVTKQYVQRYHGDESHPRNTGHIYDDGQCLAGQHALGERQRDQL